MSLQHIIRSENDIRVIESKFMSLDRTPFDRTMHVMPLDRRSCHWIRNVIPSDQRLIEKVRFPECFSDFSPRGCSSSTVFCFIKSLD